jgi:serine/threonine protein kinase
LNEVEIMKDLDHPNIIHMFGSFIDVDFGKKKIDIE